MELKKFNGHLLAETCAHWIDTAIELDMSELEYQVNLDWAGTHIDYTKAAAGDGLAYGIFEDNSDVAVALIELVYSRRPGPNLGLLKMLRVIMCPHFSPSQAGSQPDVYLKVLDIYAEAILGTIRLTGNHPAKTVKIFGRNAELLQLLFALNERFNNGTARVFQSRMEGRWLAIST